MAWFVGKRTIGKRTQLYQFENFITILKTIRALPVLLLSSSFYVGRTKLGLTGPQSCETTLFNSVLRFTSVYFVGGKSVGMSLCERVPRTSPKK